MKKVLSLLMAVVIGFATVSSMTVAFAADYSNFPVYTDAAENRLSTAPPIEMNCSKDVTFRLGTYTNAEHSEISSIYESNKALKFTPSQSGYYEASMYMPLKNQNISVKFVSSTPDMVLQDKYSYLDNSSYDYHIYTSQEVGTYSGAVISNTARGAAYLTQGTTYYIIASCNYDNYDVNKAMATPIPGSSYTYFDKTATIKLYSHKHTLTVTNYSTMLVEDCSLCGYHDYFDKSMKVSLSATSYTYNGKVKSPKPVVKNSSGTTLKNGTDYTLKYSAGRKNVGRYSVTVNYIGNYYGSKTLYFTIKPAATTISSLKSGNNKITVKWKKKTTQVTGYQVQYSTSSKFKKATTKTISKNKTTSYKKAKLKNKKKYYVRVRTYKTVKVNGKNTKIYSSWSKAKSVKTK